MYCCRGRLIRPLDGDLHWCTDWHKPYSYVTGNAGAICALCACDYSLCVSNCLLLVNISTAELVIKTHIDPGSGPKFNSCSDVHIVGSFLQTGLCIYRQDVCNMWTGWKDEAILVPGGLKAQANLRLKSATAPSSTCPIWEPQTKPARQRQVLQTGFFKKTKKGRVW